jgi:hypothetical protein
MAMEYRYGRHTVYQIEYCATEERPGRSRRFVDPSKKVPSVLGGKGAMIPLAEHSIWSLDAAQ